MIPFFSAIIFTKSTILSRLHDISRLVVRVLFASVFCLRVYYGQILQPESGEQGLFIIYLNLKHVKCQEKIYIFTCIWLYNYEEFGKLQLSFSHSIHVSTVDMFSCFHSLNTKKHILRV